MITCRNGYQFYGLKSDTKPTDANNADEFYVIDDGCKKYMFDYESKSWLAVEKFLCHERTDF